jgi:hypothetical protein
LRAVGGTIDINMAFVDTFDPAAQTTPTNEIDTTGLSGAEMGIDRAGAFPGLTATSFVLQRLTSHSLPLGERLGEGEATCVAPSPALSP